MLLGALIISPQRTWSGYLQLVQAVLLRMEAGAKGQHATANEEQGTPDVSS